MASTTMTPGAPRVGPSPISRALGWVPLVLLALLLLIMLFPILLIVLSSFKTEAEYTLNGPFALPQGLNFDALVAT